MVSKRVQSIKPSGVREIFEMATKDSINLGLGELDFDPPQEAIDAIKEAIDKGYNRYGPTKGFNELREKVAQKESKYRSGIEAANVVITASGTQATMAAMQTLFDPGDEVLIPEPGFVTYEPDTVLCDARPVSYYLDEERGFQPDLEQIKESITPKSKGIIVNSPANPTGMVLDRETFNGIVDVAKDHGLWIISDEVYEDFVYQGKHYSFCEALENSVILNSFSKSFAVTGWRIGYLVAPKDLTDQIAKYSYSMLACPPSPPQYAIWKTFDSQDAFIKKIMPVFDQRRRTMSNLLNEIQGFSCPLPHGSFYAFPSFEQKIPSRDLAKKLVASGVICAPGTAFGEGPRCEGHLRFSYAASEKDITRGLGIVKKVIDGLSQ
jgi:aspartate aminotransferase